LRSLGMTEFLAGAVFSLYIGDILSGLFFLIYGACWGISPINRYMGLQWLLLLFVLDTVDRALKACCRALKGP